MNEDPDALVAEITREVRNLDSRPMVVFGHSMGGLIGYEVTVALAGTDHEPLALVVSGAPAPHVRSSRPPEEYTDDDLAATLVDWGGTVTELVDDPALRGLTFPPLRADLRLCDRYHREEPAPLAVPLSALAGRNDEVAPIADVQPWQGYSREFLGVSPFRGDHFFVTTRRRDVIDHVEALAMRLLTRR